MGFPGGSLGIEPAHSAGDPRDMGSIPGLGRYPGWGLSNPCQYSCLENPCGQRSLTGYSSQVAKSQTWLKSLSTAQHTMTSPWNNPTRGHSGSVKHLGDTWQIWVSILSCSEWRGVRKVIWKRGEIGLFQQIIPDKEIDKFSFGISILYKLSTLLQTIKKLVWPLLSDHKIMVWWWCMIIIVFFFFFLPLHDSTHFIWGDKPSSMFKRYLGAIRIDQILPPFFGRRVDWSQRC